MVEWALANPALATYIFLKLTGIQVILIIAAVICLIAFLVFVSDATEAQLRRLAITGLVSAFLAFILPSQKEAAIILGVSATAQLAKTDLAKQAFQILEKELEQQSKK